MSGLTADERDRLTAVLDGITGQPRRVLVIGSRHWGGTEAVSEALDMVADRYPVTSWPCLPMWKVVHGASGDVDAAADAWALRHRPAWHPEPHLADWFWYGRAAGPMRNTRMVASGVDLCLAFILNGSRGATDCAGKAEAAGVPTWRCQR